MSKKTLIMASALLDPLNIIKNGAVLFKGRTIEKIGDNSLESEAKDILYIKNGIIFPALINVHDHLFGTYLPRVGTNRPYLNWLPWDNDLKNSSLYKERSMNQPQELYLLGTYKNLLSGVTTVMDHMPHSFNKSYISNLPIRVLKKYRIFHSVASFRLDWGEKTIEEEHQEAVKNNIPFITHCSEGFDSETVRDVEVLDKKGCLSEYTVLIHGIAFSKKDMEKLKKYKVNVVWCPESNLYMYNKTAKVKELLDMGINVSLGTDSTASGSINMLAEFKTAYRFYKEEYGKDISFKTLIKMVTVNASKTLRLPKLGSLKPGNLADILVIKKYDRYNDPYENLSNLKMEDIKLLISDGHPVYGDAEYKDFFQKFTNKVYSFKINGRDKIMIYNVPALIKKIRKNIGKNKKFAFAPID